MKMVNIYDAKTNLSKLLEEVQEGKVVVIAKSGKPIADLLPHKTPKKVIKFGMADSRLNVPNDNVFDGLDPDIQEMFYGKDWKIQ